MAGVSIFKDVPLVPLDHVFKVNNSYNEDKDPRKVNMGIGGKNLDRSWLKKMSERELPIYNLCNLFAELCSRFLAISAYRDDDGKPMVLPVVASVEKKLSEEISAKILNHEYLQIDGLGTFCQAASKLLLGDDNPALAENRVC